MRTPTIATLLITTLLLGNGYAFPVFGLEERTHTVTFSDPIDGVSLGLLSDDVDLSISGLVDGKWTEPTPLEIEKEFDPLLRESNLVMFPTTIDAIRISGTTTGYEVHPIRVSHEPAKIEVAARLPTPLPKILSRKQWGADESLLVRGEDNTRSDDTSQDEVAPAPASDTVSPRIADCEEAQRNYANEFKTTRTVRTNDSGETLRWTRTYSPQVKLIAVHHTALAVTGDTRPAVERMRALYEYHADNRGWGDIGYHYVIDESGQIYEGKSGGDYVVGGHAYCNNIGSVGVSLMGNFDREKPSQDQMHALQWLIIELARKYDIELDQEITFHGKRTLPVVRHKDLVSTACPGYYVSNTINQVRGHVIAGDYRKDITFPTLATNYTNRADERRTARLSEAGTTATRTVSSLTPIGGTTVAARPGGEVRVSLNYRAATGTQRRARIADVARSNQRIGIYQDIDGNYIRVRDEILLPESLRTGETTAIRLRIEVPTVPGNYTVDIGDVTYTVQTEGRRVRLSNEEIPNRLDPALLENTPTPGSTRTQTHTTSTPAITVSRPANATDPTIRIRLGYESNVATIAANVPATILGVSVPKATQVRLGKEGSNCVALVGSRVVANGIVRFDPGEGFTEIASWDTRTNRFRGILECRVVDGELALINELPIEQYLMGLAEEPDTEPFEKQRAFAIAARSYAAYYTNPDPATRKFPGKPYDGDDSAARFQKYGGVVFEQNNTEWQRAVQSTAGIVVKKNGGIVKTPYYSSNSGRTKSPEENGWKNFPYAEVFASKPDPWCAGFPSAGHGVGMSGCGAEAQANEGKSAEEILEYYYPTTELLPL